MNKEKGRVPKLRFPGFTEDWEQRKLLTVLNKIVDYRGRTPKKLGLDWSLNGHLALSALNVKMGYVDKTVDAHYGDDHLYSVWMKDNDLYEGQVLFTTEAPMGNVAQVPDNNKYILSQRTIAFVPDRSVISDNFLAVVLSASKCQKSLINRASGGTAKGVSQKTLSEIFLDIPQSLSEQDKVSELIKKLSKIITLHQRKLEHLNLKKKALLQKLFPKDGERYPELRFPGFTDAWEQCKLDDIAKIKTGGGTPKTAKPEYWSGNIPWIQSSDLVEGDITHVNINKFINNNALKNSAAKLISRDSIALVTRVGVGKVAVINQDFTTSQDFLSLSDFDRSDIKFLAYQLYRLMQENAKVLQGTSIKGITKTELIEQSISIPNSGQEQHLISNVLSKIDSIITLHQRKLEHLQLQKKALLQQMFV
ncbi:MAG: restriction endonuclease subunit S [Veillonella sp.]|nr:restriction endonuclease subunit S [Veillonella sp.]